MKSKHREARSVDTTVQRQALVAVAATLAIAELVDAPSNDPAVPGIIFGLVVLAGAVWAWRSTGVGAPILLGVLGVLEFLGVVFVYRTATGAPPPWVLWIFGLLSLAVVVGAVVCLITRTTVARGRVGTA
ncbi:MAG: hypothetical protein ACRDN9_18025 [Streptosporangiaceae bacterium]